MESDLSIYSKIRFQKYVMELAKSNAESSTRHM